MRPDGRVREVMCAVPVHGMQLLKVQCSAVHCTISSCIPCTGDSSAVVVKAHLHLQ